MAFLSGQEKKEFNKLLEKSSSAGITVQPPKFVNQGGGTSLFVVRLVNSIDNDNYEGYIQSSSDPATRADGDSLVTIKTIVEMGAPLAVGLDEYHNAYLEDGVYYISDVAVFK